MIHCMQSAKMQNNSVKLHVKLQKPSAKMHVILQINSL